MSLTKIDTLLDDVFELSAVWGDVELDETETFVITQALGHGALPRNQSTVKALTSAIKKAEAFTKDDNWVLWQGRSTEGQNNG